MTLDVERHKLVVHKVVPCHTDITVFKNPNKQTNKQMNSIVSKVCIILNIYTHYISKLGIYIYTYIHTQLYIYIYTYNVIYIYVYIGLYRHIYVYSDIYISHDSPISHGFSTRH
jgi:hypothetical protein